MHMHIWYAAIGRNTSFSFKLPCSLIGLFLYSFHCFNHISNWYQIKSRFCVLCRPAWKCSQQRRFLRASRCCCCCCCCCAHRCRGAVAHPITSTATGNAHLSPCTLNSEGKEKVEVLQKAPRLPVPHLYVQNCIMCVWSQSEIDKRKLCWYTVNPPAAEIGVMK